MKFLSTIIIFIFLTGSISAQVTAFAKVDHLVPDGVDTQGGIALTVSGGTPPYNYLWNPGASTTQNINNIAAGQYSLTLTSGSPTYSNVYDLGYKVMWTNTDKCVFRNDSLISNASSTSFYGFAVSKNTLAANTNGWFEYVVDNVTGTNIYYMGFTDAVSPNPSSASDIDYGICYTTAKQLFYYESGTNAVIKAAPKVGDVVKVERVGNTINYKINNVQVRTQTVSGLGQKVLKVKANLRSSPVQILNVGCSFSQMNNANFPYYVEAAPIIKHCSGFGIADGSIKATPRVAFSNTYAWQPGGSTSQTNSSLSAGTHTLTLSDGAANSSDIVYNIGYKVDWTNMDRCYIDPDTLINPTVNGSVYATAMSKNTLDPNTDGWVEYVVDNPSLNIFYIGFCDNFSSLTNVLGDMDYAISWSISTKSFQYYENGTNTALTYNARVGDVLRLERVGNTINYKMNGVVLRTTTVSGVGQKKFKLKAQMLSANRLVNVGCSFYNKSNAAFDNYVQVIPTIMHNSGLGTNDGSIKVVPRIPLSNTYAWQPGGATTNTVSSLPVGSHSVTVTDGSSNQSTHVYNVGYKVQWTNKEDCFEGHDSLIAPTNNGVIIGNAVSKNTLAANTDGWLEYVFDAFPYNQDQNYIGFADNLNALSYTYTDIDYGFHFASNYLYAYDAGAATGLYYHLRVGDVLRLERTGNNMIYKINGYTVRTVSDPAIAQKELKIKANMYAVNRFVNVGCSFIKLDNTKFDNYVQVIPEVTHNSSVGITDGKVKVSPRIPASNTYEWIPGNATTCAITPVAPGSPTVTVRDGLLNKSTYAYNVGYKINWTSLYNATVSEDTLKGTVTGAGSGISGDTLLPNTDGWIEYVYSEPTSKGFHFGFLDVPGAASVATDIDYGFSINILAGSVVGYSYSLQNGVQTGFSYNFRVGDVFRIERVGDDIKYYLNNYLARTSNVPGVSAKALIVKAVVVNKAKLIKLGASFTRCKFTASINNAGFGTSISCATPTVTLTGVTNAPAGSTYLWTPGNATTSSINVSNTGEYKFKVTNPANGCAAESKLNVTTPELPQMFLNTTLLNDTIVGTDSTKIQVGLNSVMVDTLDGGGTDTLGINPSLSSNTLTFTFKNNNFTDTKLICVTNKLGCINSVQAYVDSVYVPLDSSLFQVRNYKELVIVPANSTNQLKRNTVSTPYLDLEEGILMSPNGDNHYDKLKLARYETTITSFELNIYSISQELVYTTHEKTFSWDGKDSNSNLLKGTFNYTMNIDGNITNGSFLIEK